MKKRMKELIAVWLAALLLLQVPVHAAEYRSIQIYTGSQSLTEGMPVWPDYSNVEVALDTPLNEQTDIMESIAAVPQGYILNGWKLWKNFCGWVEDPSEPKALTGTISEEEYEEYGHIGYLLLEPLLFLRYKILQQPAASNHYTVKGAVTEDGVSWEETTDIAYQWFEARVQNKTYAVGEEDAEGEIGSVYADGSYDSETQSWQSTLFDDEAVVQLGFPVRAGDVITVRIPEEGFDGMIYTLGGEYTLENGVCSLSVTEDTDEYMLGAAGGSQFTCSVTVKRTTVDRTALAGQTGAALTAGEDGKQYLCECTFEADGAAAKLSTELVTYTHIHTWSEDYTTDEDMHWRVCTECGQEEEREGHSYENEVCTVCGMINPAHTHRYVDGVCAICGARDPGMIKSEITSGADAPGVTSDMDSLEEAILSSEDRAQIADGANITIRLVVNNASGSVKDEDKAATEDAASGLYIVGRYLDISLVKIIQKDGDMTESSVHDTGRLVRIVIEIPEELRGTDREFAVIRIHNGKSTVLKDLDDDPNTITIETDQFSSYAIVYQDEKTSGGDTLPPEVTPPETQSPGTTPPDTLSPGVTPPETPASGAVSPETPGASDERGEGTLTKVILRTGDPLPQIPYTVLLLAAAGTLAYLGIRKKRRYHA